MAGTSPSLGLFFSPSFPGRSSASGRLPLAVSAEHRGPMSSKLAEAAVWGRSRAEGRPLRLAHSPLTPSRVSQTGKTVSHLPGIRHMVLLPGTLAHPKGAQSPSWSFRDSYGVCSASLAGMLGAEHYQWPLANGKDLSGAFLGFPMERDRKRTN